MEKKKNELVHQKEKQEFQRPQGIGNRNSDNILVYIGIFPEPTQEITGSDQRPSPALNEGDTEMCYISVESPVFPLGFGQSPLRVLPSC